MDTDYYKILEVERSASHDEIKKMASVDHEISPRRVPESKRQESHSKCQKK